MRIAPALVVLLLTSACSLAAPGHADLGDDTIASTPNPERGTSETAPDPRAVSHERFATQERIGRIAAPAAPAIPPGKIGIDPLVAIYPGASFAAPFAIAREDAAHAITSFRVTGAPTGVSASVGDGVVSFIVDVFTAPSTSACVLEAVDAKNAVVASAEFTLTIANPTFAESAQKGIAYLPAMNAIATSFTEKNDGSFLTLGLTFDVSDLNAIRLPCVVEHHTADGRYDLAFGHGGAATISLPLESYEAFPICYSLAVQTTGAIIVAGITPESSFVARLTADGKIDTTFGAADPVYFPNGGARMILARSLGEAFSLMIDPSDRIWIAGSAHTSGADALYLDRLDPNGHDDPTFAPPASSDPASMIVQTRSGSIYVGGYRVTRLTADGAIDPSFADGGSSALPWGDGWTMGMALTPNDDVIVAGHALAPPDCNGGHGISGFIAKISDANGFDDRFGVPALGCGFAVSSVSVDAANRILVTGTNGWVETAGAMLFANDGSVLDAFPLPTQLTSPSGNTLWVGMYGGAGNASGAFTFLFSSNEIWQSMFVQRGE